MQSAPLIARVDLGVLGSLYCQLQLPPDSLAGSCHYISLTYETLVGPELRIHPNYKHEDFGYIVNQLSPRPLIR